MYKCPTEGCNTEMKPIEVSRVFGKMGDMFELIVDEKVGIFYCEKCSHSIIISDRNPNIEIPEKPSIIIPT